MAPANRPVSRPAISVSQPGILTSVKKDAETIAPSAATEPTERSMPAVMMTKVMPKAKMATVAAWMPILRKLLTVKKCGVAINNATHKMMSPTRAPLFITQARNLFCCFLGLGAAVGEELRAVVTGNPPLEWQMLRRGHDRGPIRRWR